MLTVSWFEPSVKWRNASPLPLRSSFIRLLTVLMCVVIAVEMFQEMVYDIFLATALQAGSPL